MARHGNAVERTGRSIRLDDEHWDKLRTLAYQRHQSVSGVIRDAIVQYIARNKEELPIEARPAAVSDADWYDNHRVPLHNGGMPIAGTCAFCDNQFKARGWK